jgi:tRNA pseudouridine38-40 synthase
MNQIRLRQIKLLLEYDGTSYNGWQSQKKGPFTLQEVLEDTVARLTKAESRVVAYAAGRTDAGVHALGQAASFRTKSALAPETIKKALNAMLPADIRVLEARDVPGAFNPRRDALKKTYFYLIATMPSVPVFFRRYLLRVPQKLDLKAMNRAAIHIKGKKDFSSFRAAGCVSESPVKEMSELEITEMRQIGFFGSALDGEFIRIAMTADSFLRHMARNIAGTLIEAGKGKIKPEDIPAIIEARDRRRSGPTAPAHGLFLEKVYYRT